MTEDAYLTLTSKDLLCLVCQDRASGNHYGVPTCDGCRGFFKRSVRKNAVYTCKNDGRCKVDALRRNQCQACRYRKCLEVRMNPDAVQLLRECRSSKRKIEDTNDENRPSPMKTIKTRPLSSPGIDSSINSSENSDLENSKLIKSEELSPPRTPIRESQPFNPFLGFPSTPHLPFPCHPFLRPDVQFPLLRPSSQLLPPPLLLRPDLLSAFNHCLSPVRGMPCMFFTCPLCLERILQSGANPLRQLHNHGFQGLKGQVV